MRQPVRLAVALALLVAPATAADPVPKQVVAPPSDFPLLRLPEPASAALRSRSALVPIALAPRAGGRFGAELSLPLDGEAPELFVFSPRRGALDAALATPRGPQRLAELSGAGVQRSVRLLPLGRELFDVEAFRFTAGFTGGSRRLELVLEAPEDWSPGPGADGFVALAGRADLELETRLLHHELTVGRDVGVAARLAEGAPAGSLLETAVLRLFGPDGSAVELPMVRGAGGELVGSFLAAAPGRYVAQVDAAGRAGDDGAPFRRTTQTLFPVVDASARIVGARGAADGARVRLALDVELAGTTRVQAAAFVHGDDGTPVAWLGRIAEVPGGAGAVALELPLQLLADAGVAGGLELRDVRLQDVDTHAVLARAERLPVAATALAAVAPPLRGRVERNPALPLAPPPPPPPLVRGLMLVHGYCSGGVWPPADFHDAATFADFDANRSHDEFAQLLLAQGAALYDSFGVVGHSQGGAAALHLLTFYESPLDLAEGERLVQSVGTPYQGTPLAGNLALLGTVFGAGCGENTDMTPDGAALWLANVPSEPRGRVHYWTTSFFTGQAFDNCLFATGIFLANPEDGTTEMARGQLPGAHAEGHVQGWCHTTGMKYTAQYQDHARNAEMDALAAR